MESSSCIAFPQLSQVAALSLPSVQVPANLNKPIASKGSSTGSTSLCQNLTLENKSLAFLQIKSQTYLFKPQIQVCFKSH